MSAIEGYSPGRQGRLHQYLDKARCEGLVDSLPALDTGGTQGRMGAPMPGVVPRHNLQSDCKSVRKPYISLGFLLSDDIGEQI